MKKRNMSLILALALIISLVPATAFADTGKTLSGDITSVTEITQDTTITDTVNITGDGKIIVKKAQC